MTDSAQLANINRLLKKAENEPHKLTDEEKTIIYGAGNPNRMGYTVRDGAVVSRQFPAGKPLPEGWEDTPAKFGLETHPGRAPDGYTAEESVVGYVPGAEPPAAPAPFQLTDAELEAATRPSTSPITTGQQQDFGDTDDGAAGPSE